MLKKKLIIITFVIIGVFNFSLIANPLNYALAQKGLDNGDDESNELEGNVEGQDLWSQKEMRVAKLIKIMSKAADHIQEVFAKLEEQGVEIPEEAKNSLASGLNKSQTAILLFDDGQLDEAGKTAIAAMKDFKQSMKLLRNIDFNDLPNAARRVSYAINRTMMFINRLEVVTERIGERGYNTTNIKMNIEEAKSILENATELVAIGEVDKAARTLGEARIPISEIIRELHQITKADRFRRMNGFIDNSIGRLTEIEERSEDLLPPQMANRIKDAIGRAKAHLEHTRNLIMQNRFANAFNELEEMVIDAEEGRYLFSRAIIR